VNKLYKGCIGSLVESKKPPAPELSQVAHETSMITYDNSSVAYQETKTTLFFLNDEMLFVDATLR
jgi:hypothetical protein